MPLANIMHVDCFNKRVMKHNAQVEIARGASTYQEIANKLGVSRATVSKNPAIRRAMEASIRDRRPADKEAAEEFKFQKGR